MPGEALGRGLCEAGRAYDQWNLASILLDVLCQHWRAVPAEAFSPPLRKAVAEEPINCRAYPQLLVSLRTRRTLLVRSAHLKQPILNDAVTGPNPPTASQRQLMNRCCLADLV
jgi:hypothetical protein